MTVFSMATSVALACSFRSLPGTNKAQRSTAKTPYVTIVDQGLARVPKRRAGPDSSIACGETIRNTGDKDINGHISRKRLSIAKAIVESTAKPLEIAGQIPGTSS